MYYIFHIVRSRIKIDGTAVHEVPKSAQNTYVSSIHCDISEITAIKLYMHANIAMCVCYLIDTGVGHNIHTHSPENFESPFDFEVHL